MAYRPFPRQRPQKEQRVYPLFAIGGTNRRPLLGNRFIYTLTTIEELLKAAFSDGSAPWLYKKDFRPAEESLPLGAIPRERLLKILQSLQQ